MNGRRLFQIAAWLFVAAIIVLSLVKPSMRPVTILPHGLEHAAIFLLAGLAVGVGYSASLIRNIAIVVAFAVAIEAAQMLAPGRHATLRDLVVDAVSAVVGVVLGWALARLRDQRT
jgi:VanZ family protein